MLDPARGGGGSTAGQSRPVIALLTDFGARDHYVGTMKGVMLGICPDASLIDLVHEIPPQDVLAGAIELDAAYRFFPPHTVFLVVVDPGVGSGRRAIAVEAGGYRFVAPDNGVLTAVLRDTPASRMVALEARQYALQSVSRTFEGRDRLAPAAAWLARGVALDELGPALADYVRLDMPAVTLEKDEARGTVLRVDRFGNLITNLDRAVFDELARGRVPSVRVGDVDVPAVVGTYAEAPPGGLCALIGSSGHLEIAINGGSAAERLGVGRGAAVTLARRSRL